eukprot:TRINITY_DN7524_c0_g2_i3.p2 TRINITY_DN7524_c0_g2~~TRINITY_DN7524_c0_g2_i3.p2  ORF type:complete len:136 (-),score=31.62 TRINITY_DN7524_c0_g2_i3:159-566(-)
MLMFEGPIDQRANPFLEDTEKKTAALLAFEFGHLGIVKMMSGWTREWHCTFPTILRAKTVAFVMAIQVFALPDDMIDSVVSSQVCCLERPQLMNLVEASKLRAQRDEMILLGYPKDDQFIATLDEKIRIRRGEWD